MLVPNQTVNIKVNGRCIKYYKDLGYEIPTRFSKWSKSGIVYDTDKEIVVKVEDLPIYSIAMVDVICDVCGKKIKRQYCNYITQHTYEIDTCVDCCLFKKEITSMNNFGTTHPLKSDFIKNKIINTNIKKYGCEYTWCNEKVKDKIKETNLERYGVECVLQSEDIKEKIRKTNLEKYGVENPMQSSEVVEKSKNTMLKRYGVEHALLYDEFKKKANKTLLDNKNVPVSSQQIELHNMIQEKYPNAILNYPCDRCIFDIALILKEKDIKIDIEYDGFFWHKNQQQKDRKRDEHFKLSGWKILRIKSGHDLPLKEALFEAIDYLINTKHSYNEIKLDDWDDEAI